MMQEPGLRRSPSVARRSRYRSHPQRPLFSGPHVQMTPPLTPQSSTDAMPFDQNPRDVHPRATQHQQKPLPPINTQPVEEQYEQPEDQGLYEPEPPVFQNYLRAFYHFHPTAPVSSASEQSSITIPINQGDVILVHSIQPNGWADGTLLQSGARGWLPTNYCEAYDHDAIKNLLTALTYVWEFLRGHDDGDVSVFAKQDYVRGMIAGVRVLFERTKCLNRESPLVQQHVGLRRLRKGILGDLSAFVKAAKYLQELCNNPSPDTLYQHLDDAVFKAFKVVTRGIKFLDLWIQDVFLKQCVDDERPVLPPTPPADGSVTSSPVTSSLPNSLLVMAEAVKDGPVASASAKVTQPDAVRQSIFGDSAMDPCSPGSAEPTSPARNSLYSSRRVSRMSLTSNGRPASLVPKRSSTGYRWSHCSSRKPLSPNHVLASEQLGKAHDAFLGYLGAYIGLHLQSRCSIELLITTQQSVTACQSLLAVVDEVYERDSGRSDELDQARENMHFKLTALVQATRDIFSAAANDEQEVFLPDQGKQLVDAATLCVRCAGECVARTRTVIERTGDFEFEPSAPIPSVTASFEQSSPAQLTSPASLAPLRDLSDSVDERPRSSQHQPNLSESTATPLQTPSRPQSFARPPSVGPLLAPPNSAEATPVHSTTSSTDTATPVPSLSFPRASVDTVAPPRFSSLEPHSRKSWARDKLFEFDFSSAPALDLVNPAAIDEGIAPNERERAGSVTLSTADTASTYHSSFRRSEQSLASRNSTQATSATDLDHDAQEAKMTSSVGNLSLSDAQGNPIDEADDTTEDQILTKTYAHELTFNKDGQVTGGSLPALVERLTTHDSTPDAVFVNTFYLTFRLFTTPREFAQTLVARFEDAGDRSEVAAPIRLRVYNVLKGWLESHWHVDSDSEAVYPIVEFANNQLKSALPSASKRLLELVRMASDSQDIGAAAAARKMSILGRTSTNSSLIPTEYTAPKPIVGNSQLNLLKHFKSGQSLSILDFDAMELARQFTLIESKIFCAIQADELLALEWTKKQGSKASNVKAMSSLSTDLANLVADSILAPEEAKKRALVVKQWIKIGKKCLELNNYDSLMAIICSLNSSMVSRLKKTWDLVPAKNMAKLESMRAIVDVSKNYAVLRQRLSGHVAPCLPFVGIYLTDLTFVDVGNQTTRQLANGGAGECSSVINFDKHVKTGKIIGELQRFQVPYKLTPVPEMQEWIAAQVARMHNSSEANVQGYYRRSLLLEPRETQGPPRSGSVDASMMERSTKEKFEFWSNLHFPSAR